MSTGTAKKLEFGKFYRETRAELKKVSWPSRSELIQHTEVVLTSIVIIGAALWLVDLAFGAVLDIFLK